MRSVAGLLPPQTNSMPLCPANAQPVYAACNKTPGPVVGASSNLAEQAWGIPGAAETATSSAFETSDDAT